MQLAGVFEQIQTLFTGESERQIVDAAGYSDMVRLREGSVEPGLIPASGITEQDRLSYVVNSIER